MTNGPIWDNNNITNTIYQKASGSFTPSTSVTYYIGWQCYSAANMYNLYVDDIEIRVQPIATYSHSIPAGNTNQYTFDGTGASIQFSQANTGAVTLQCEKFQASPGFYGSLPSGVVNIAQVYWNFNVTSGIVNGTYSLTLNIEGISGVTNPNTLKLLKRANAISAWTEKGTGSVNGYNITWSGIDDGFSEFTLGSGNDNPLPLELKLLSAYVKSRDIYINWKTTTEVNVNKFIIERKLLNESDNNTSDWIVIGERIAAGNSNSPKEYNYVDKNLNTGTYIYRLKMVDNDGSYKYSDEVKASIDKPSETLLRQNYPNSFNPATKID